MGLQDSWKYHKKNRVSPEDYADEWDYESVIEKQLENFVKEIFNKRLEKMAQASINPNVLEAKEALDKERTTHSGRKY